MTTRPADAPATDSTPPVSSEENPGVHRSMTENATTTATTRHAATAREGLIDRLVQSRCATRVFTATPPFSQDQHRVAVTVKPIPFAGRLAVQVHEDRPTAKRGGQQQR